tara:strand:+ start:569 stop:1042 length:474 start_codon:yes stop_codon:yes gene_type:complete
MIEQIYNYFTLEMIFLWLNIGVLPFWFILIFFPKSKICTLFTISIFPIIIFSSIYIYVFFNIYRTGYDFLSNFNLYLGIENLLELFSNESFLILFWIHFLSINLFCGAWIVNDYLKYEISKVIIFFPLLITYFVGPIGLFLYWFIRIFYAKKISLYD